MFWQYNEQELYTPVCGVLAICLQQESTQLLLLNWINAIAQHISYTVKVASREDLPQPSSDHWEKTTTERKQQLRENNHWEKTTERKQPLRENNWEKTTERKQQLRENNNWEKTTERKQPLRENNWEKTTERKQPLRENNNWEKTTTERKQQLRENELGAENDASLLPQKIFYFPLNIGIINPIKSTVSCMISKHVKVF